MNSSNFRFTLDMHSTQSQISIPVLLGDTSRKLYISLSDGEGTYVIEDGCIATFSAKKPDGNPLFNSCAIENNKTIVYEFTENTTNCEGIVKCEIKLYGADGKVITSPRFILVVDATVIRDEEVAPSESENTALANIFVAEEARKIAENNRVTFEDNRASAEIERKTAENERVIAEAGRKSAENERKTAEGARVLAEKKRDAALDKAVKEAIEAASEGASIAVEEGLEDARKEYIGFYGEVVLPASAWALNTQAVTISDVEDNDFIMFFPSTIVDNDLISTNKVYCRPNAENGVVQFSAATTPTADIHLMYYVTRRGEG